MWLNGGRTEQAEQTELESERREGRRSQTNEDPISNAGFNNSVSLWLGWKMMINDLAEF